MLARLAEQVAALLQRMNPIALQLEHSVEAKVGLGFAWRFQTDVTNWNDPPAPPNCEIGQPVKRIQFAGNSAVRRRGLWLKAIKALVPQSTYNAEFDAISTKIVDVARALKRRRSALVAVSGIDGSGKGYVASCLSRALQEAGLRVAAINVDGWLNLPCTRFSVVNPAQNFYERAIRFDELFRPLVLPLKANRFAQVEVDFAEETALTYSRQTYSFDDIDVILLEGIFLLKRQLQHLYDLSIWIDCTFETALERAIGRGQEGLTPEEVTHAYETIYFPAQVIHFAIDHPRQAASIVFRNDPRIVEGGTKAR
jgi:uridine kinase